MELPEGLIWGLFVNNDTGKLRLVNRKGEEFGFTVGEAPHIAAALADHCNNEHERNFVADAWGPMW